MQWTDLIDKEREAEGKGEILVDAMGASVEESRHLHQEVLEEQQGENEEEETMEQKTATSTAKIKNLEEETKELKDRLKYLEALILK